MITLDRLVNVLGGYGVSAQLGSVPRSAELRSVALPESTDGDVLLAIGVRSAAEALQWARSTGAVAVLVRADLLDAPIPADIAVLTVEATVSWSELAAVVYGLVLEGRETESGRGPTDLFALADSLADAIGDPVVIVDRMNGLLAYSRSQHDADPARVQTILDRQIPDRVRSFLDRRGVFAHLNTSDEPLFIAADDEHGLTGRMAMASRVGRELLGSVWVACPQELVDGPRAALTNGARTVALHLLRSRASADLERQIEAESVIRLLDGNADAGTVASKLGLPPGELRVIALRAQLGAGGERHTALLLAFELATAGFGWSRPGRSALVDNTVYTVLPDSADAARRWIAGLRAGLPHRADVRAGISAPARVATLTEARREADECLALHEASPTGPPPAYDEAWDDVLLQRLRTAAAVGPGPSRGPVAVLARHDAQNATQYVATLQAWLAAQGDPVAAGAALGVHENTVRYRLRKMAEVVQLPLNDPRKRLALMIELATLN